MIDKFSTIFDGLRLAYGTFKIEDRNAKGKATGKAMIVREERTEETWQMHLDGTQSVGIIPINEDNSCRWGCIDIDTYPLDHKELITKIRKLDLPLVVCRSKSGGAHCFLFTTEWISAEQMQETLQHIAASLGYGGCEIFPKQVKLFLDRGDVGNFLNTGIITAQTELAEQRNDGDFLLIYDTSATSLKKILASNVAPTLTHVSRTATGDGSTAAFTVTNGTAVANVLVFLNGVVQRPTTDYSISGTSLTFGTAPAASDRIDIRELPR